MTHGIVKCSCGEIIMQCRCFSCDKEVRVIKEGCGKCKSKWQELKTPMQINQIIEDCLSDCVGRGRNDKELKYPEDTDLVRFLEDLVKSYANECVKEVLTRLMDDRRAVMVIDTVIWQIKKDTVGTWAVPENAILRELTNLTKKA